MEPKPCPCCGYCPVCGRPPYQPKPLTPYIGDAIGGSGSVTYTYTSSCGPSK